MASSTFADSWQLSFTASQVKTQALSVWHRMGRKSDVARCNALGANKALHSSRQKRESETKKEGQDSIFCMNRLILGIDSY